MQFSRMLYLCVGSFLSICVCDTALAACPAPFGVQNHKPDAQYVVSDNGTVIDKETGLMWQQCVVGLSGDDCSTGVARKMTGQAALAEASQSEAAGYNDWRLPNIKELMSIVDPTCIFPAINTTVFPNTPKHPTATSMAEVWYDEGEHWTSTFASNSSQYYVGFSLGGSNFQRAPNTPFYVRLVRGGVEIDLTLPAECGETLDPSVALDLPIAADSYISRSEIGGISISGTATCVESGQEVEIVLADGFGNRVSGVVSLQPDGKFGFSSVSLAALEDGPITITASTENQTGERFTFELLAGNDQQPVLDTVRPTIGINTPIANDDGVDASELAAGVLIDGISNAENGQIAEILVGGLASTAPVVNGNWSMTIDNGSSGIPGALDISALADGSITILAEVGDRAGNTVLNPASQSFVLDLVPPQKPTVNPVTSNYETVSWISGTYDPVEIVLPVVVLIDGQTYSSADGSVFLSPSNGQWYVFNAGPLANGTYDVQVTAEYPGGVTMTDDTTGELTVSY